MIKTRFSIENATLKTKNVQLNSEITSLRKQVSDLEGLLKEQTGIQDLENRIAELTKQNNELRSMYEENKESHDKIELDLRSKLEEANVKISEAEKRAAEAIANYRNATTMNDYTPPNSP